MVSILNRTKITHAQSVLNQLGRGIVRDQRRLLVLEGQVEASLARGALAVDQLNVIQTVCHGVITLGAGA